MVDYSKWNNIDLSDDDSDCHPNIEKNTWLRLKKETKLRKQEEAQMQKAQEDAANADNIKRAGELEEKLRANEDEKLRKEHTQLLASIEAHRVKRAKEEEIAKKYPKWDDDTICRDGFSKTIVNSKTVTPAAAAATPAASTSSSSPTGVAATSSASKTTTTVVAPAASKSPVKAVITEPTRLGKGAFMGKADAEIVSLENKAQHFAMLTSYEDMYHFIGSNADIISVDVNTYLLLHCSDCLKRGLEAKSKKYLKASCVVQYCNELGRDGIALFFSRMRDSNPKYRTEFERETMAYWGRIKEKLPELKAASAQDQADTEEDAEYEVLGEINPDAIPQIEEQVPVADVD